MSDHGHDHNHGEAGHKHPAAKSGPRFLAFCGVELVFGVLFSNSTLVSSAAHDFVDGISLTASKPLIERWKQHPKHWTYCTKRGLFSIFMAVLGPIASIVGLAVEPHESIAIYGFVITMAIGAVSLTLNLVGFVETLDISSIKRFRKEGFKKTIKRQLHIDLGMLIHFFEDSLGSVIIIVMSALAYRYKNPHLLYLGTILIIVSTMALGLWSGIHTLTLIAHREPRHNHAKDPYNDQKAAS